VSGYLLINYLLTRWGQVNKVQRQSSRMERAQDLAADEPAIGGSGWTKQQREKIK